MRPMSFLPAIKCSDCGMEIEISKMADHVCSNTASQTPLQTSPKGKLDRAATFSSGLALKSPGLLKPGRMPPPPRIDSSAANKPFIPHDQLTPMSNHSDQKSLSPMSAGGGNRLPYQMVRSVTSPVPRHLRSPSPDLSFNMDCAFPPFPTARSTTPEPKLEPKPRLKDTLSPNHNHRYAEADPLFAPLSPRTNGGASVLKRMNTIAPGPFDAKVDKSFERSKSAGKAAESMHKRSATQSSAGSSTKGHAQRPSTSGSERSRSSTISNGVVGLPPRPKPGPPARPARPEGIDAFLESLQEQANEPTKDTLGLENRSRTFPLRKDSRDTVDVPALPVSRRPSEPLDLQKRPTNLAEPSSESDQSSLTGLPSQPRALNVLPLRNASRSGSKAGMGLDDIPPVPSILTIQRDLPGKPLHTPSDSGASDDSVSSRSAASSRSSPPASEASGLSRRPSKASPIEPIASIDEQIPRTLSPEPLSKPVSDVPPAGLRPLTPQPRPVGRNGAMGYNRGNAPEPLLPARANGVVDAPESPMDPAIQRGIFSQRRPSNTTIPKPAPQTNLSTSPPKDVKEPVSRRGPSPSPSVNRRGTAVSKGKCRGCSEPIIGKSVKAADGRLTGRYHKQCFVCKTCRAPFQTADFYVINNFPYCERHYHQLNGSLCKTCDRGIEGQYLETDQRQKFHPNCFSCRHCRIPLRDDYFEVGGKVFCERHAFHAAQQNTFLGPGRRNPERRTTRLMMMM